MMRPLRTPAISLSSPWIMAACVRAIPTSSSASCCAEISIAFLRAGVAAMVAFPSMFSWKRPDDLGVTDGRLALCKRTPNCVSSQADPADAEHYIAPIAFKGTAAQAMAAARRAIESMARTTLVHEEAGYTYA